MHILVTVVHNKSLLGMDNVPTDMAESQHVDLEEGGRWCWGV